MSISPSRIARIKQEHGLCPDQDLVAVNIARQQDELRRRERASRAMEAHNLMIDQFCVNLLNGDEWGKGIEL